MDGSNGFTILFSFNDERKEFPFINGSDRFQAYVTRKDMDVPVYFVTRLHRYDVYEVTALIASYQLTRAETKPGVHNWMEIRTRQSNAFMEAIGQAIDAQEKAGVKMVY
ncbi:hypothetical protein [Deminuibacter soli]|uniref:Uncharacterized protein n=1 Tax=Deminuibacter soli TaxID=2291815 RepID=A0A3E1NEU9_9BACT|nr:hypothetical protein [Deminuibacter soli]RFM26308.1 hypothetical protein DXN05_20580 [Deminuibacter soli]